MDRERYFEWIEHQLRFFSGGGAELRSVGHRRSTRLDETRELFMEAHGDGTLVVGVETTHAEQRERWGEIFRRTRRGSPPWPPGPPPESIGAIELHTDDTSSKASLHFRWMFLGQNFLLELPTVSAGLSWLLLTEPSSKSHPREIELPEDPGEPMELDWDISG